MAQRKTGQKKKQAVNGGIVSLLIMLVFFAGLVTLNTYYPISSTLPTWQSIKTEFDSYFNKPQEDVGYVDGEISVHFIDIGQGNAILIQSNGKNVLVDAGDNDKGRTVVNYLRAQGVDKLDYAIATHPHADHIGGMDIVISNIPTDNIIMPELKDSLVPTTKTYEDLIKAIQMHHVNTIKAKVGDSYDLNGGVMRILGPSGDFDDLNNMSVAVKYTYGNRVFLTTGDMETQAEEALLATGESVKADVFSLGHHGSSTSNDAVFLDAVGANYYIALMGYENRYGHPHQETIQKVADRGATFLRSDVNGTIVFTTDGETLNVTTEK